MCECTDWSFLAIFALPLTIWATAVLIRSGAGRDDG